MCLSASFRTTELPHPKELHGAGVEDIGSVSEYLAPGLEGWVEAWLHNEFGCFDSPTTAERVIGDEAADYQLFAYRLLPLRYGKGQTEPMQV